ncbi:glycosyltransferase [Verrucomicrobiaceae bacterium R5-34]|nr:glycosyltransferase [Verrucomicrobiaceae bacterium R5-34]
MRKVSVIITTHNRVQALQRALNSVICQTYKNIEIIVVDDCSQDDTPEYLRSCINDGLIDACITNNVSLGACKSRNLGIDAANGYYIAGLDDDDEFTEDRIELLVNAYRESDAFVFSLNEYVIDGVPSVHWTPKYINSKMIFWHNLCHNQVLAPKENFIESGLFDESIPSSQDYDMWVKMLLKYRKAKCVQSVTQRIYVDTGRSSVASSDKKRLVGVWIFYCKYKKHMNRLQRSYILYRISRARGRDQSFPGGAFLLWKIRLSSFLCRIFGYIK